MKSFIKYIFLITIGISASSCDYLDVVPDQIPTLDNAFSDRYTTEQYLASIYWALPATTGWNVNPGLLGSLEMVFCKTYQTDPGMRIGLGLNDPTSALINYWPSLYANIRDCNTFLNNVEKVQDLPRPEKNRMIAEVKCLKAYMHFYLLSYYGPICIVKESLPVDESTQGTRIYRNNIDESFAYILELLDEVIESKALPSIIVNTSTELSRLTESAAYSIKAKVSTYWASPLFNGNTDYNNFLDHEGFPFFNQVYDPTRWEKAAEACKAALEACNQAGLRLYQFSDFTPAKSVSDTTLRVNAMRQVIGQRWNEELIWTNNFMYNAVQGDCLPRFESSTSASATGRTSLPFSTVDLFYSNNGIPIEEDPSYDYANRFDIRTGDEDHKYYIQKGEQTAAMNFDRELRFYSTVGFDRGKWYGNSYKNEPDNDLDCLFPKNRYKEYSSEFTPGVYNATGYFPKKLVNLSTFFTDANAFWTMTFPFPNMRYADLLLLYSEVLNEMKDAPDDEVYHYIDLVRARAGLEGVVDSWRKYAAPGYKNKPATKAGMREIIQRERKIELACEGVYFWDSRRWKTAIKEQNRLIKGWNVLASEVKDYYTETTIYVQKFIQRDYFSPIPESDLIKNPQLIQNPGW